MFWEKEKVYIDILDKWRKNKIWEFNLFDKVIIEEMRSDWDDKNIWKVMVVLSYSKRVSDDDFYVYTGLLENWEKLYDVKKAKKYYWEFQEEFETMEQVEKEVIEIKELEKELKNRTTKFLKLSEKLNDKKLKNLTWLHKEA